MAIVHGPLLSAAAIDELAKQGIDYFCWKGLQVLRSWPKYPVYRRSEKELAWQKAFKDASDSWISLPLAMKEVYNQAAKGMKMHGRNLFMQELILAWKMLHPEYQ